MFEQKDEKTVPVSTVKRDLESQKRNVAEHLRDCSDKLSRRIQGMDEQIEDADKKLKISLGELRTRLIKEKIKVDRSIKDIEHSTDKSWNKMQKKAGAILTEAKIETQKIEERVENLID